MGYYDSKPLVAITQAMDISLENHIKNILFPDEVDLNRIQYSSNEFTFRKRSKTITNNESGLNLPFYNYKLMNFDFDDGYNWWRTKPFLEGIFIPELAGKIRISPVALKYEASFWCNRDDELRYAMTEMRFDSDKGQTLIASSISINGVTVPFSGVYKPDLSWEPQYQEKEWLEKNKIHSMGCDFTIYTFIMKTNYNVCIPTQVIFDFATQHGTDNLTDQETNKFFVDYFSEDLQESPINLGNEGEAIFEGHGDLIIPS